MAYPFSTAKLPNDDLVSQFVNLLPSRIPQQEHVKFTRSAPLGRDVDLTTRMRSLSSMTSYVKEGVGMFDAAERDLTAMLGKLMQMKNLADTASESATSNAQRTADQVTFAAEREQLDAIARSSQKNGVQLLDGTFSTSFHTGMFAEASQKLRVSIESVRLKDINDFTSDFSNPAQLTDVSLTDLTRYNTAPNGEDAVYKTHAQIATDNAIDQVGKVLSSVQAKKSQFASIVKQGERDIGFAEAALAKGQQADIETLKRSVDAQKYLQKLGTRASDTGAGSGMLAQRASTATPNLVQASQIAGMRTDTAASTSETKGGRSVDAFVVGNADLLQILDRNTELRKDYFSDPQKRPSQGIAERKDLQELFTTYVSEQLPQDSPITKEFLQKEPTLTQFLALNPGDILGKLKQSKSMSSLVASAGSDDESAKASVAREAASLFSANSPLNEDFFKENQDAALFFLKNKDVAEDIRRTTAAGHNPIGTTATPAFSYERSGVQVRENLTEERAASYYTSTSVQEQLKGFVADEAQKVVGDRYNMQAQTFVSGEDFSGTSVPGVRDLTKDEALARRFVAEDVATKGEFGDFLRRSPELMSRTGDREISQSIDKFHVRRAFSELGRDGALSYDFLSKHQGLSRLLSHSSEAVDIVKDNERAIRAVFNPGSEDAFRFEHLKELRAGLTEGRATPFGAIPESSTNARNLLGQGANRLVKRMSEELVSLSRPDSRKVDYKV